MLGKLADDTKLGRAVDNQTLVLPFRKTSTGWKKIGKEDYQEAKQVEMQSSSPGRNNP